MQDMIENRRKVGLVSKMQLALMSVRDNGILWFIFVSIYYVGSVMARFGLEKADALRRKKNLPGINSPTANKFVWENWDWSGKGDEWTISPEWKDSVVRNFIAPYFNQCGTVVEIGPGAGRWTEFLITAAGSLIGIDISEACVDECRKRLADGGSLRSSSCGRTGRRSPRFIRSNLRSSQSTPTNRLNVMCATSACCGRRCGKDSACLRLRRTMLSSRRDATSRSAS